MDVLSIINVNLQDFKVCNLELPDSFKLCQICPICFKMVNTIPLNKLVFQNQTLQDILESTTSCFNFRDAIKGSEEIISSCLACLQQLLISYLFKQKVQTAHELFKTIIGLGVNEEDILTEPENFPKDEPENNVMVKVEVVLDPECIELKPDFDESHNQDDGIDSEIENDTIEKKPAIKSDTKGKKVRMRKKKEVATKKVRVSKARIGKKKKSVSVKASHKCSICDEIFNHKKKLNAHMVHVHSKRMCYECDVCSKKFYYRDNLRRHRLIHTGEKPHVCTECGQGFIQKTQLVDHVRRHTGEKLTCEFCGKLFNSTSTFDKHRKSVHPEYVTSIFKRRVRRERNEKGERTETSGDQSKMCDICGKTLSSKTAFNCHMMTHGEKPFSCDHCKHKFTTKVSLIIHSRIHTGEKPYTCEKCGKTFRTVSAFRIHKLIHTGEKPHSCHICSKKFRQSAHLQLHLQVHAGVKAFACDICGKDFLTKGNLTQHTRIHTDDKPYSCEFCGKAFAASNNLKKHKATHQNVVKKRKMEKESE